MSSKSNVLQYLGTRGITPESDSLMILGNGPTRETGTHIAQQRGIDSWGINLVSRAFTPSVMWQMHSERMIRQADKDQYLGGIPYAEVACPVMCLDENKIFKKSVKYPLWEMMNAYRCRYFSNTLCYQIALGMYMGYKELCFYGVDFHPYSCPETVWERPGVEYWMGRAAQDGIKFSIPEDSFLLTGRVEPRLLYGYEMQDRLTDENISREYSIDEN